MPHCSGRWVRSRAASAELAAPDNRPVRVQRFRRLAAIGSFASTLFTAGLASADPTVIVIANDPGGYVVSYIRGWENIASLGNRVEIRGYCVSACTLVLGLIPADRVCVGEEATFGFHSVSVDFGEHSPAGTRYLWSLYPPAVQDALRARGWDGSIGKASQGLIMVAATAFYPRCDAMRAAGPGLPYLEIGLRIESISLLPV